MTAPEQRSPADTYNAYAQEHGWPAKCDPALAFEAPEFAELVALWRNGIPRRSALTARVLKSHLPYLTIYERFEDAGGAAHWRVRLMGSVFAQMYGDLTGKIIDYTVPPDMVMRFDIALGQTLRQMGPLRFVARMGMNNKDHVTAEYFMAPLAADDGSVNMIFSRGQFGFLPASHFGRLDEIRSLSHRA